ncbi:hypothetical protein K2173_003511 [Erythroxylum novogranatense]|uniref:Uncharacterized protein n=1 Tax=Erythroxylum novogranatense TaxID=1862640 RepID=A0AAV8TBK8_9ROSI|nr:hypothetical protein K2173_003511 [Erythroxylum novogranatense]
MAACEGILAVCLGCGRVNHRIENYTEVVVLVITGAKNVGVAKDMAMVDASSNSKEDIFGPWLVSQCKQRRIIRSKSSSVSQEKTISNTITGNRFESLQVEDSVVVKVDKGSVGLGKRISSVKGPVGLRDKGKKPGVVKGVGRSGREMGQFQTRPIVPSILSTKVSVLPVIDNVGGGVVAKFVLNEPKPPDPIASDIIVYEKPPVISETLAHKVACAMNDVVLS